MIQKDLICLQKTRLTNYSSKNEQAKNDGLSGGVDECGGRVEGRGRMPPSAVGVRDVPLGAILGEVLQKQPACLLCLVRRPVRRRLDVSVRALHALSPGPRFTY